MKVGASFRYLADPLFLCGISLYALNQAVFKPLSENPFLAGHFNDLLLAPCALPVLLLIYRGLGLRPENGPPSAGEIFPVLFLWAALFEWAGPRLFAHAVGDWLDVAAYLAGGLAAWAWWRRPARNAA